MENINTRQFWNKKIKEEKKILISPIYLDKNISIANFLKNRNGKLLDIGVGYGTLEKILINRFSKLEFFGIDISKEAINRIKELVNGEYLVADAQKIPFGNNSFDFIVELDVLEHLNDAGINRSLKEVTRVIKNKGIFIVSVPLNESVEDKYLNRHIVSFDENNILKLLIDNGFGIIKTKKLYAFKTKYRLKTFLMKILHFKYPNLIIVYCRKK